MCQVLSDQLIDQASAAQLELRILGIESLRSYAQLRVDLVQSEPFDLLNIELIVEEVRIDPLAALLEYAPVIVCRGLISNGECHLFAGP